MPHASGSDPVDEFAQKKVRFSLDLSDADYKRLCRVWLERRDSGHRTSMRALILEAVHQHDYGTQIAAS